MNDFDSFNLKMLIPLAVGSMLVASGCSPEGSAARKYCKTYKECDEDGFDDEFDSMGECVKLNKLQQKATNYRYKLDESDECSTARQKMQLCYAKELTCDAFPGEEPSTKDIQDYYDWAEDAQDECEDQIDDFADECDGNTYSYSYDY
jgi:hypothetical protein